MYFTTSLVRQFTNKIIFVVCKKKGDFDCECVRRRKKKKNRKNTKKAKKQKNKKTKEEKKIAEQDKIIDCGRREEDSTKAR